MFGCFFCFFVFLQFVIILLPFIRDFSLCSADSHLLSGLNVESITLKSLQKAIGVFRLKPPSVFRRFQQHVQCIM